MNIDFTFAPWGMAYAALMYVIGNGVWTNHLVRNKPAMGWLLWGLSAVVFIVLGAVIEQRFSGTASIWSLLTDVNVENHWIVVTLYALLSIPGAAGVLFRQSVGWTRLGTIATALIVFIPLGMQIHDPNDARLMLSLGITAMVCGLLWVWSALLDTEPEHKRKTVPVEEMSQ